jgi:hypothetical protein
MIGVKSFMARAQISGSAFWKRESKKKNFLEPKIVKLEKMTTTWLGPGSIV